MHLQKLKDKQQEMKQKAEDELLKKEKKKQMVRQKVQQICKETVKIQNDSDDSDHSQAGGSEGPKIRILPYECASMDEWRKKQRLHSATKVFVMSKGYKDLKIALSSRGWVRNPDYPSDMYDYKWTLFEKDI